MELKPKYDFLISRANVRRESDRSRRWSGGLFQTVAPAAENVRSLNGVLVRGATKVMPSEDRNAWRLIVLVSVCVVLKTPDSFLSGFTTLWARGGESKAVMYTRLHYIF